METTASIFVSSEDAWQAGVMALLAALVNVFSAQICKNIGAPSGKTSVTLEGDARYSGEPGFWVHVTSKVPGFTGPVSSYVEGLVKAGVHRYFELEVEQIAAGNPQALFVAQKGFNPEASVLSGK